MIDFTGKTVLITGGSRGIGAACARLFAQCGANVAINYWSRADKINPGSAERLRDEIIENGGSAQIYNANITNEDHLKAMLENIRADFSSVTHLVLNAYLPFTPKALLDYEWEEFEKKVNSDIKSFFILAKLFLPDMIANKEGVVIGVSSGMGRRPNPHFSPYSLSKAALNSFIRSIAVEYGHCGIRANVVAPGFTLTDPNKVVSQEDRDSIADITPLDRIAQPEDIASAIVMMASDNAKFVSGGYLPVDGGLTIL
ncbi:MAG: 3-oxoacyl-[acyl-carrier protein] reductase [Flavobacteriales bacterium]|jgi:3-oxoacyl-[acyl-carrier protein] reductase